MHEVGPPAKYRDDASRAIACYLSSLIYLLAKNARWLSEILSRELLSNLWRMMSSCFSVLEDLFFHGDEFL